MLHTKPRSVPQLSAIRHKINSKRTHFGCVSYYVYYERAHETLTQPWGFPLSNMRPYAFTPPKLLKLTPGELPGCSPAGVWQGEGGLKRRASFVFTTHPFNKKSFCFKNPFTLPESSYNEVPESIYLFIQQTQTEYLLFVEHCADTRHRIVRTSRSKKWR